MQVNGTGAQITAAGHGDNSLTKPAKQRANKVVRGAHLARELLRHMIAVDVSAVDLHSIFIDQTDIGAQFLQDTQNQSNVADLRDIFDPANAVDQKSRRENGNSSVLCAADLNCTVKRLFAVDYIFLQS